MFHEIDQDKIDRVRGMDITVVTTAKTDDEGRALLKPPRLPVQGELTMAKTALINKATPSPSSRFVPTPAASGAAAPLGLPQVRPVPYLLREMATAASCRRHQEQLVTATTVGRSERNPVRKSKHHDNDRPDRRHADRVCATRTRRTTTPCRMPCSKLKSHIAEILQARGLHRRLEGRGRRASARRSPSTSSTARTASGRSPASSASPSPACASTRSRPRPPTVLGGLGVAILSTSSGLLTDRQAEQEGRGRGSPRLRLVRDTDMSRIGRLPVAVPAGRRRHDRRPGRHGQGPEGRARAHRRRARSRSSRGRDRSSRSPVPTTSAHRARCTA